MNLFEVLHARRPAEAATFLETPNGVTLTYGELWHRTGHLASALHRAGVRPGERVLAQVEKSATAVCLYMACLRAGAVYVPLNTSYTVAELDFFLEDAQPAVLVCVPERAATLEPVAARHGVGRVETLAADGSGSLATRERDAGTREGAAPIVERADTDLAAIIYTSGTTGRSKGAMLSHRNLAVNALALERIWGWRRDDVLLHALPVYHVHGLFVALHCALLGGSAVRFLPSFEIDAVLAALQGATVMMGVPTYYQRLLDDPRFDRARAASMRVFISGSAPLRPETFAEFERRSGHRILERYGMSEAGMITSNPLDGERVAGTVGFPLPEVDTRLRTPEGEPITADAVGVLEVRGPNVFSGYWRKPDKTAEELGTDGWFVTGDLASLDTAGRVSIVGREKDLIISGGLNVYPKEIETQLDGLPGVHESAVFGIAHADLGEAVVAAVVPAGSPVDEAALRSALRDVLAPFKLPKRIVARDPLPRNAMGKVQKSVLRDDYAELLEAPGASGEQSGGDTRA